MPLTGLENWFELAKAVIFAGIGLFLLLAVTRKEKAGIKEILIIAFLLRVAFGILTFEFSLVSDFLGDPDLFHQRGVVLTEALKGGVFVSYFDQLFSSLESLSFAYFTAPFYFLSGNSALAMKMVNSFFGAMTVYLVYKVILELFSNYEIAKRGAFLAALLPSFVLFSPQNYADSAIVFFSFLFVYLAFIFIKKQKFRYLLAISIVLIPASLFRLNNVFIYGGALFPFVLSFIRGLSNSLIKPILVFLLMVCIIGASLFVFLNLGDFMSVDFLEKQREAHTRGRALYLQDAHYSSWWSIISYLPLRIVYFVFSPLPWQITRPLAYFAMIEGAFLLFLLFFVIFRFKRILSLIADKRLMLFLLIFFLLGILSYSIVESNIGAAMRHRILFTPLIIIFASPWLKKLSFGFFHEKN